MRYALIGLLALTLSGPATAAVQANLGVLTCTLAEAGETGDTPPSQTRAMVCAFKPTGGGPEEHYSGEVRKVGADDALSGKLVLMWSVLGPDSEKLAPGLLAQSYIGQVGRTKRETEAPQMLIGEADETFVLRPMTDAGTPSDAGTVTVVVLKAKMIPS